MAGAQVVCFKEKGNLRGAWRCSGNQMLSEMARAHQAELLPSSLDAASSVVAIK